MKRVLFLMGAMAMMLAVSTPAFSQTGGAEIDFTKEVHDFGNMKQGGDASTEFLFTNTGTEPLVISNAKGSCGCTVPQWPKEPIMPGKQATIKVKYDSKRIGPINKSVTITSNATNAPQKVIRIKGNIEKVPTPQTSPVKAQPAAAPTSGGGN